LCFLFPLAGTSQTLLYSENFDSYTLGDYIGVVSNTWWRTWSGTPGGADDVKVSNEQAFSAPHALKFYAAAAQGDGDMVLKLENKTTGQYEVEFKMYIGDLPAYGGYFNMLHILPASAEWAFSLTFLPNNDIGFSWNNVTNVVGTYSKGVWNDIKVNVNLDLDSAHLWVNSMKLASWQWSIQESGGAGLKALAGVNFYAYAGGDPGTQVLYYIDDVKYTHITGIGVGQPLPIEWVKGSPNPTKDVIRFENVASGTLELYNTSGKLDAVVSVSNGIADISALTPGVYVARIITGDMVLRTRVVKW
jgi:hypothetical protein